MMLHWARDVQKYWAKSVASAASGCGQPIVQSLDGTHSVGGTLLWCAAQGQTSIRNNRQRRLTSLLCCSVLLGSPKHVTMEAMLIQWANQDSDLAERNYSVWICPKDELIALKVGGYNDNPEETKPTWWWWGGIYVRNYTDIMWPHILNEVLTIEPHEEPPGCSTIQQLFDSMSLYDWLCYCLTHATANWTLRTGKVREHFPRISQLLH